MQPPLADLPLPYLAGYPPLLHEQARALLAQHALRAWVLQRHPEPHDVRNDRALYDYTLALKAEHLRSAEPLAKVVYAPRLHVLQQALGTHTAVSRVQGGRLKAKREIRIASLFKDAPADLLRLIVVHELAHLRHREHDRAFYALCHHIEPDYALWERDLRLWLTALELEAPP
jgi:predicted metal-dependent hydrolase